MWITFKLTISWTHSKEFLKHVWIRRMQILQNFPNLKYIHFCDKLNVPLYATAHFFAKLGYINQCKHFCLRNDCLSDFKIKKYHCNVS